MSIERGFAQIGGGNHEGGDLLALRQFGESNNGYVLYLLMFPYDELNLGRMHIGTTTNDEIGSASQEMQETVLVECADITWIGPTPFETIPRTARDPSMNAPRHARRAQADNTRFAWREDLVILIYHLQNHMRQYTAQSVGPCLKIGA